MLYGRLTVNPITAAWNTVARFDGRAERALVMLFRADPLPDRPGQPYSIMPRR